MYAAAACVRETRMRVRNRLAADFGHRRLTAEMS